MSVAFALDLGDLVEFRQKYSLPVSESLVQAPVQLDFPVQHALPRGKVTELVDAEASVDSFATLL